jgi:hypothetical protein
VRKPKFYQVRTTDGIAQEMVRYEGNKIVSQTEPECDPRWSKCPDLQIAYTTWDFHIAGVPNLGRWASFGIRSIRIVSP